MLIQRRCEVDPGFKRVVDFVIFFRGYVGGSSFPMSDMVNCPPIDTRHMSVTPPLSISPKSLKSVMLESGEYAKRVRLNAV